MGGFAASIIKPLKPGFARGKQANALAGGEKRTPFGAYGTTFPPLKRWDYGDSALCHRIPEVSIEQPSRRIDIL